MKILVVDDMYEITMLVAANIETYFEGCEVMTCYSLEEAIMTMKDHGPFDLVITDFNIPNGNEGATVTQASKVLYPDTPVIVLSGALEERREQIHELCNADAYLSKPFDPILFKETLTRYLDKSSEKVEVASTH